MKDPLYAGSQSARIRDLTKQLQERRMQVNLKGHEIKGIDKQIKIQQVRLKLNRTFAACQLKPSYDFELTKNISLRELNPRALPTLRGTFSLPELLFDFDFPGHFMRRIRSVSVSIPCVIGPYTSLAATRFLTEHRYRVNSAASDGNSYLGSVSNNVPISQVAISSGMQDSGTF
ncbi:hypothetical protein B0T25DRAFT_618140 [Lasiosphaeria hispida]|uniref:Tc toxin complex TcA C-terminal TcB-binding domain-containing protein n=1 Tax=Lasiosphaeria hispida TaxID=260671 RepID=A0AAJ0M7H1_9PEZI|nr:hypothetical protein B0T25DRAFT_618140 [Lasiosphaeria hispida]